MNHYICSPGGTCYDSDVGCCHSVYLFDVAKDLAKAGFLTMKNDTGYSKLCMSGVISMTTKFQIIKKMSLKIKNL